MIELFNETKMINAKKEEKKENEKRRALYIDNQIYMDFDEIKISNQNNKELEIPKR